MPLSRSESTFFAVLSSPGGRTAIWSETTCGPAMDFAIDSACALSLSEAVVPVRVTTPLSRSWLTLTSLSPAWSSDLRRLSVTSGDLVGVSEHAAMPAKIRSVPIEKNRLVDFMFLLCRTKQFVCPQGAHDEIARFDGRQPYYAD